MEDHSISVDILKYGLIYEREINFPEKNRLVGMKSLTPKKIIPNLKFDIRFHLDPSTKIMKTQDEKTILIN